MTRTQHDSGAWPRGEYPLLYLDMILSPKNGRELLGLSLLVAFSVGVLHQWALGSYLYWVYDWFDILMHFLAGLCVSLFSLWLFYFSPLAREAPKNKKAVLFVSLGAVLILGLFWEVFELFIWHTYDEPNFVADTLGDIVLDILGGFVAYRYFVFHFIEINGE